MDAIQAAISAGGTAVNTSFYISDGVPALFANLATVRAVPTPSEVLQANSTSLKIDLAVARNRRLWATVCSLIIHVSFCKKCMVLCKIGMGEGGKRGREGGGGGKSGRGGGGKRGRNGGRGKRGRDGGRGKEREGWGKEVLWYHTTILWGEKKKKAKCCRQYF